MRQAGQSGWVYRSDAAKGTRRQEAPAQPRGAPAAAAAPKVVHRVAAQVATPEPEPVSPPSNETIAGAWTVSTGVIGLGLHVAAVPLVMPLYVTAAISRKLGLLPR